MVSSKKSLFQIYHLAKGFKILNNKKPDSQ